MFVQTKKLSGVPASASATSASSTATLEAPVWTTFDSTHFASTDIVAHGGVWQVPQFTRVKHGDAYKVTIRGLVRNNAGFNNTDVILTLPPGHAPPAFVTFNTTNHNELLTATVQCRVDVHTNGNLVVGNVPTASTYISLDGITYWTN